MYQPRQFQLGSTSDSPQVLKNRKKLLMTCNQATSPPSGTARTLFTDGLDDAIRLSSPPGKCFSPFASTSPAAKVKAGSSTSRVFSWSPVEYGLRPLCSRSFSPDAEDLFDMVSVPTRNKLSPDPEAVLLMTREPNVALPSTNRMAFSGKEVARIDRHGTIPYNSICQKAELRPRFCAVLSAEEYTCTVHVLEVMYRTGSNAKTEERPL